MEKLTPEQIKEQFIVKALGKFRVDVQGVGESIWVSNALRFDTEAEAERYARDLFARWMGMQSWRVVPESTPEREEVAS